MTDGNDSMENTAAPPPSELETAQTRIAELEADCARLTLENDGLAKALDAVNLRLADAPKAVKAKAVSVKLRKLGPVKPDQVLDRASLKAAIAAADEVEVAFSDGQREVAGVAPLSVTGAAWKDAPIGLILTDAVGIHGPGVGQGSLTIKGYALLIDGVLAAFTLRSDPLIVAPGAHVMISDDIYF